MKVFKFKIYRSEKHCMLGELWAEVALKENSLEDAIEHIDYMLDGLHQNCYLYYVAEEDGVILKLLTVQEAKELNEEIKEN